MPVKVIDSDADTALLRRAVIGPITEDRNMWRINWLKSLLDDLEQHVTVTCDDPSAFWDAVGECREMVRDVNNALAEWPQISNSD